MSIVYAEALRGDLAGLAQQQQVLDSAWQLAKQIAKYLDKMTLQNNLAT